MYYGLVRKPEDQLPGLISAYVQVGGRRHRIGTGSGEAAREAVLEDRVGRGQALGRVVLARIIVRPLRCAVGTVRV